MAKADPLVDGTLDVPLHIDDHHGVYDVDASSDGTRLYVTCADKSIKVLDTATWKVKKEYLGAETSDRVAISPSKQVIAASADPELTLYDAATFQIRGKVTLDADVECMRFVDDATLLAASRTAAWCACAFSRRER